MFKKTKNVKSPPVTPSPAPKPQSEEARVAAIGHNVMITLSLVAIAGVGLFLILFFSSDLPSRLIASHTQTSGVTTQSTSKPAAKDASSDDASSDAKAGASSTDQAKSDGELKDQLVQQLSRLSDADWATFIKVIHAQSVDADQAKSNALLSDLIQGHVTDKQEVIDRLSAMNEMTFHAFLDSSFNTIQSALSGDVKASNDQTSDADSKDSKISTSLEDAYKKAEKKYPGQVSASKRLKRIADLNATGYRYYVVEKGDTLLKLSQYFHVPLGQLVELNGIHDADQLPAGEILLFPKDTKQPK